jgi:geranylgeranyl diphosphate synthase type II
MKTKLSESSVFGPELAQAQAWVEERLANYLRLDAGCPPKLRDALRYSLLSPGKRLRPMLVLAACDACGGDVRNAMPAACAVEMIHTYSLIHDDLPAMDNDDLRRGRPSCHVAFDEATAILTGDALIPLAFEIISKEVQPVETANRCVQELAHAAGASQLVGGQCDDLSLQHQVIGLEALEAVHRRKTGAMFTVSLRLGCLCGSGNENQLMALSNYGENLGLAFQITDDLLDLVGDEAKIGKRTGKDSEQGKQTYPGLLGEVASRELIRSLAADAVSALVEFDEAGNKLRRFAEYVVSRNY